jgi:hypothetical protein
LSREQALEGLLERLVVNPEDSLASARAELSAHQRGGGGGGAAVSSWSPSSSAEHGTTDSPMSNIWVSGTAATAAAWPRQVVPASIVDAGTHPAQVAWETLMERSRHCPAPFALLHAPSFAPGDDAAMAATAMPSYGAVYCNEWPNMQSPLFGGLGSAATDDSPTPISGRARGRWCHPPKGMATWELTLEVAGSIMPQVPSLTLEWVTCRVNAMTQQLAMLLPRGHSPAVARHIEQLVASINMGPLGAGDIAIWPLQLLAARPQALV